jgi:hypothetical protein
VDDDFKGITEEESVLHALVDAFVWDPYLDEAELPRTAPGISPSPSSFADIRWFMGNDALTV